MNGVCGGVGGKFGCRSWAVLYIDSPLGGEVVERRLLCQLLPIFRSQSHFRTVQGLMDDAGILEEVSSHVMSFPEIP